MTQDDDTNDVRMMNLFHESFQYTRKTHVNIENYLTLHGLNKDINNIIQLNQQKQYRSRIWRGVNENYSTA